MSHSSFRRRIAVVVLGMALAAPWAMASEVPSRSESGTARSADFAARASWDLFPRIWVFLFSTKNGCRVDPFGCPQEQSGTDPEAGSDGCSLDSFGHCQSGK